MFNNQSVFIEPQIYMCVCVRVFVCVPYVRPPSPIEVKKLMAKRVFLGLSRGKRPSKNGCRVLKHTHTHSLQLNTMFLCCFLFISNFTEHSVIIIKESVCSFYVLLFIATSLQTIYYCVFAST